MNTLTILIPFTEEKIKSNIIKIKSNNIFMKSDNILITADKKKIVSKNNSRTKDTRKK